MPKTVMVERVLYSYDELSEKAKERAREKYREHQDVHYDFVYDDADTIAKLMGIEIGRRDDQPAIYWSGFWSQGDGACFEGRYYGVPNALEQVMSHAPQDQELHGIATVLDALQAKYGGKLRAVIKHSGHYHHKYCTDFEIELDEHDDPDWVIDEDDQKSLISEMRDFMQWIYDRLEQEYEWQNSDENVAEALQDGVTFDASGKRLDEDDL